MRTMDHKDHSHDIERGCSTNTIIIYFMYYVFKCPYNEIETGPIKSVPDRIRCPTL